MTGLTTIVMSASYRVRHADAPDFDIRPRSAAWCSALRRSTSHLGTNEMQHVL